MANDIIHFTNILASDLDHLETERISSFIEGRYQTVIAERDRLGVQLRQFMARNKIYDPESQAGSAATALIETESQVAAQRSLVDIYTKMLGEDDPRTQQSKQLLAQYQDQSRRMAAGRAGALESMSLNNVPAATVEYLRLKQDYETKAKELVLLGPMYEQSRYDEVKEIPVLNLLEPAMPPLVKARPKRSLVVASAFVGTFIIAYVLIAFIAYGKGFLRRYRSYRVDGAVVLPELTNVQENSFHDITR
jgi:capsule polysaccharide export protein KpsE/RkpR